MPVFGIDLRGDLFSDLAADRDDVDLVVAQDVLERVLVFGIDAVDVSALGVAQIDAPLEPTHGQGSVHLDLTAFEQLLGAPRADQHGKANPGDDADPVDQGPG